MQVTATSSTTSSSTSSIAGSDLGKDEFFKLLLTQLQYQDPLNPMENAEFIAQLAQFSTLEKMQSLDSNIALMLEMDQIGQANRMIGKEIEASIEGSEEMIKGTISSAKMVDGKVILSVGEKNVNLTDIVSISETESSRLAQASNLIKMEVEARIPETGETVSGIVDAVEMKDGDIVLKVEGRLVKLRDITSVAEGERVL